jgi:hypothetical protein
MDECRSLLRGLLTAPVSQGIMCGLMLGKPLGIAGLSLLGIKMGWVGRCRLTPGCPGVDRTWFQRVKLQA